MNILLNELSLSGQFTSVDDFVSNLEDVINLTNFILTLEDITLYKSQNLWSSKVTEDNSLQDILRVYGNNKLTKLKIDLAKLNNNPPFWETEQMHLSSDIYLFNGINVTETSLAESIEREKLIISFKNEDFLSQVLVISKNGKDLNLCNFINLKILSFFLYKNSQIDEYTFCKNFYKNTKLDFSKLDDDRRGFNMLPTSDEKKLFLNQFMLFSDSSWKDILKSDGLKYKKYKSTLNGFESEDIYKFRVNDLLRCYGYRIDDIFYVLHFERDHKLSNKG